MDMTTYMTERVDDQLNYYEGAANKAKKNHMRFQITIILLGLFIPVVTNLPAKWIPITNSPEFIKAAITIMSLLLASLTGISNFRKFGEHWLSYRATEEQLKQEKFLFITSSGKYLDNKTAENVFVQSVESIISSEHQKFHTIIQDEKNVSCEQEEAG